MKKNENQISDSALRLKNLRENHFKLTQVEFSAPLAISNTYISEIESGERNLTKNVLVNLAEVYHISPNWLLLGLGDVFLDNNHSSLTMELNNHGNMDPVLKKLNWYCENSPFVKHSVLGYFYKLLRSDKDIIEDDINISTFKGELKKE